MPLLKADYFGQRCGMLILNSRVVLRYSIFHREALGALKKGHDEAHRQEAKRLLQKAIQKDPNLIASYLTLAALQLYQEESADESLQTIDSALVKFPKNRELEQMRMDALAIKQNLGHMVKVGAFGMQHLVDNEGWRPMEASAEKKLT